MPRHLLLPLLVGLTGCALPPLDKGEDSGATADSAPNDTGAVPTPCTVVEDPVALFGEVQAEVSAIIPTVVTVRWSPVVPGESWVSFGQSWEEARTARSQDQDDGGLGTTLLGLRASARYDYQVMVRVDGEVLCSPPAEVQTGALDPSLPTLTTVVSNGVASSGGFTLLPLSDMAGGQSSQLTIIDAEGHYVWFFPLRSHRMLLSQDRQAVLSFGDHAGPDQDGFIQRISLDGSTTEQIVVRGAHGDIAEVTPGTYATLGWDLRTVAGSDLTFAGESIVEVTDAGERVQIWSLWDALEPDLSGPFASGVPGYPEAVYWAHCNYLHYDLDRDAYYVASRYLDAVFEIDRATGHTRWILGGTHSDFAPTQGSITFDPHSVVPTEDGVLIFDTASTATVGSAAVEYALNEGARTATRTWQYETEDHLISGFFGNAQQLWNGNRLFALAANGQIDEVTPDYRLASRTRAPFGWSLGYATRIAELTQ